MKLFSLKLLEINLKLWEEMINNNPVNWKHSKISKKQSTMYTHNKIGTENKDSNHLSQQLFLNNKQRNKDHQQIF